MARTIRSVTRVLAAMTCALALCAAVQTAAAANVDEPVDLPSLLAATRVEPPARVPFSETRHNPLFDTPLELEGYVEYLAPGVLRKVIESPFEEALLIDAGKVSVRSDGETRQLPARSRRALATLLTPVEALLAGDATPLRSAFDYAIAGGEPSWRIELTPKARRLSKHLTSVSISGAYGAVNEIHTELEGGERHVMRLHHDDAPPR